MVIAKLHDTAEMKIRTANVRVRRLGWKRERGYHRHLLAETTMLWLKTIFSCLRKRNSTIKLWSVFLQSTALNSYARRCLIHFITSGMFIRATKPFLPESEIIGEIALKATCWHGQRESTGDRPKKFG